MRADGIGQDGRCDVALIDLLNCNYKEYGWLVIVMCLRSCMI